MLGLWAGLTLLVGLLMVAATVTLYQQILQRAQVLVEQGAIAYKLLTLDAIEDIDQFVSMAAYDLLVSGEKSAGEISAVLRHRQRSSPYVQDMVILDGNGRGLAAAWQGEIPDLSQRTYFTYHRDHPGSTIHVTEPQLSIVYEGEWFISVSRALRDDAGQLLGVAVGMLATDPLRDRFAEMIPHPALSVSLLSASGRLILRLPDDHGIPVGTDISERAAPNRIPWPLTEPLTVMVARGLDQKTRLSSFHPLPEYGPIAVASITRSEALAPWRLTTVAAFVAWLSFAGLSLLLVLRLRRSLAEAFASEARFRQVVDNASDIIVLTGTDGRLQYASPNWECYLGHPAEEVVGRHSEEFIYLDDLGTVREALAKVVEHGETLNGVEYRVQHRDGSLRWHSASVSPLFNAAGSLDALIGIVRDITESRQAREELDQMAHADALTGLANRARLSTLLAGAMTKADQAQNQAAVLFIDLDRFKPVNDELGHAVGDQLLVQVARRINHALRQPDSAARFGGDEFVVLLHDLDDGGQAMAVAQRIIEQISRPFHIQDHEITISCSIGIALYPSDGRNERELIQSADQAMYHAKQNGRATARLIGDSRPPSG